MSKDVLLVALLALSFGSLGGCSSGHERMGWTKVDKEAKEGREEKEEKKGTEITITLDQLPAAVKTTVQREAGGGTIGEVEKETKEGKTSYEADATIGGSPYEIKVAEDGTLLVTKLKHAKSEEKEEAKAKDKGKEKDADKDDDDDKGDKEDKK